MSNIENSHFTNKEKLKSPISRVSKIISKMRAHYVLYKVIHSTTDSRPDTTNITKLLRIKRKQLDTLISNFHQTSKNIDEYRNFWYQVLDIVHASYKEPKFHEVNRINLDELWKILEYLETKKVLTCKQMRESASKIIYISSNLD